MRGGRPGGVVLVVDGSATVRSIVRTALGGRGFEVREVAGAEEALAAARCARPDVVLLDVEAPTAAGWDLLDALAADESLRSLPVLVLTRKDRGDDVRALERGALDVVHKPFSAVALAARVGAAARVAASEAELLARNAELDAFAARASHDLKTPLAVISGMAETLESAWDRLPERDRAHLLSSIGAQARRAAAMVGDLLALARDGERAAAAPLPPRAVLDAALQRLPEGEGHEVEVVGTWPEVLASDADLFSVLANLVDNARHYGRSEDGVLRLRVAGEVDGDDLVVRVADRGPGIPAEAVPRLFRPYGRVDGSEARNPASTGIGLSIVRRAVERWGGSVGVEPTPGGGGATFVLRVPLARPPAGGPAAR